MTETEPEQEFATLPALPDDPSVAVIEQARAQTQIVHVGAGLPSPVEWEATMAVARTIAATPFVPAVYRNQPEAVVAAILFGRELGIGPMESLKSITMIDGRPTLAASLLLSLMRRGGVEILNSVIDDERAWIHARRRDTGEECEVEWTYAEASEITRSGKRLVDGDNWRNYRQDMLWARCVGRLARRLGSDLVGGNLYSTEEMRDIDENLGGSYSTPGTGGSAYESPGRDLIRSAAGLTGQGFEKRIGEALDALDPTVDWPTTIRSAVKLAFKVDRRQDIPEARMKEFWIRLANATARAGEGRTGDFPPVDAETITAAFEWAFEIEGFEIALLGEVVDEQAAATGDREEGYVAADDPAADAVEFGETGAQDGAGDESVADGDTIT